MERNDVVTMAERQSVRTSESRKKAQSLGWRSALEMRTAQQLDKARIKYQYEPRDMLLEYTTPVRNAHCADCGCSSVVQKHTYLPDFVINNVVLESKGLMDSQGRTKIKCLVETHKHLTFVMLFQNPQKKITKLVNYAKWCELNNILWLSDKKDWIPQLKEIIKRAK